MLSLYARLAAFWTGGQISELRNMCFSTLKHPGLPRLRGGFETGTTTEHSSGHAPSKPLTDTGLPSRLASYVLTYARYKPRTRLLGIA